MPELGWQTFSPSEKDSILRGMASGSEAGNPRTVQIDWTDRCNIDCFFCSQADMRRGGGELSAEVVERIFTEMDSLGVTTLNLAGGGDPLFHRKAADLVGSVASTHSFRIGTITTNAVLASGRLAELLVLATRDQITVSLNSLGAEAYARDMRTTPRNYDRVIANVRGLVERTRTLGGPEIALQFLVHDGTYRQLPAMLETAQDLGVNRVAFNPLMGFDDRSTEIARNAESFLEIARTLFRMDETGLIADVRTIFPKLNEEIAHLRREIAPDRYPVTDRQHRNFQSLQSFCPLPWFNTHVKATGDVYPCCALLNRQFPPLGNVHEKTLEQIWRDDLYRRFREGHARFIRGIRESEKAAVRKSGLPEACTRHGACFLRALPYLDDTTFAVAVDSLGRCHPQAKVSFPAVLRAGDPARLNGCARDLRGEIEIRVNRVHCGHAEREMGEFRFDFLPDPLGPGFHLLEVVDSRRRVRAAQMIEKLE